MVAQAGAMSARDDILARIRETPRAAPSPVARSYRRTGTLAASERVDRFCKRVADYRAEVTRVAEGGVAAAIDAALAARGVATVGFPSRFTPSWAPHGTNNVIDRGLTTPELNELDAVVTGCTVAIAETGTIILAGGPTEGRRALTLVPDIHVCVVRESQIVELLPEAIAFVTDTAGAERSPLTFISGPSATSDIELSRVEGVHGPRTLVVLVVSEESP